MCSRAMCTYVRQYLGSLALIDVLCGGVVPVLGISFVDGEYLASLGDSHVWICQHKLPYSLHNVQYNINSLVRG